MDLVLKRKVYNLVQFIFNNNVSEEHKNLLLLKYSFNDDINVVVNELVIDVYRTYSKDQIKLDFYLGYLANKYFGNRDIEVLKREILSKLEYNFGYGDSSLEDNHYILKESLLFICRELNKRNIDYYVIGSVPVFIKLGIGFSRFHSDIDIAINSKDINLLKEIFKDSNYYFFDNRLCSQKFFDYDEKRVRGGHEIIAQNKENEFSIGFYEFDRLDDGSITKKDYFSEVVDGKLINRVCKYSYSKEFTDLYYSNDKLKYEDIEFKYCSVEGVYLLKQKNYMNIGRNKDLYDVNVIEDNYKLDNLKIDRMKDLLFESANYVIEDA